MKTSFLQNLALFFAVLFPLGACAPISDKPTPPHENLDSSSIPSFMENTSSADLEIWEVSKVDISKIDDSKKHIVFTFDDSPAKTLDAITGTFLNFNSQNPDCPACATLFCNGVRIDERTLPALHTAFTIGFELGNHTYSHFNLTKLSKERLIWEIEQTDKLLFAVDGQPLHLLRPPYGESNEEVKATAKTPIISWLIDTLDWTGKTEEEIYQTVFSKKSDGAIVLMHDGYEATVSALKRLLPDLKEAGYQVVSVSQASKINDCPLRIGSTYIRERKPQNRK